MKVTDSDMRFAYMASIVYIIVLPFVLVVFAKYVGYVFDLMK